MNKKLVELFKRDPCLKVRFDDKGEDIRDLRGNMAKAQGTGVQSLRTAALNFVNLHPDLFGEHRRDSLAILKESKDWNKGTSLIFQQYHGQARVHGATIRFHFDCNGILDSVRNRLVRNFKDVPQRPKIPVEKAVTLCQAFFKVKDKPIEKPELIVYRHKEKYLLAYRVVILSNVPRKINEKERKAYPMLPAKQTHLHPPVWVTYVDALTGKIFFYYDKNKYAGPTTGAGTGIYSGTGTVNSWSTDVTYQLRDTSRVAGGGPEIVVQVRRLDAQDHIIDSISEDTDNNWNNLTTSPREDNQGPEVDAQRHLGDIVSYFQNTFSRNSYDGAGGTVTCTTHNPWLIVWSGDTIFLNDGDGIATDYPSTPEIIAHEFTHGIIEYTCDLEYSPVQESSSMNEAIADVFSAFVVNDWLLSPEVLINSSYPAYRNLADPQNAYQPTAAHTTQMVSYNQEWYAIYFNMGVISHLCYLLSEGGTNSISDITVGGVGKSVAEQLLYHCITSTLVGTPTATFLDFRAALLESCLELYPEDLEILTQAKMACNAVGIGPDLYVRDNLLDNGMEPYTGSYLWASPDIINRKTLSANPSVDFGNLNDDSLWENVEFGQDNHVYVRVHNRGFNAGSATVNVYLAGAMLFGNPAEWIHVGTTFVSNIQPGSWQITGPITLTSATIPAPGHYCMIAVVSDPLDPAPDTSLINNLSEYLYFVRNTNNIAYRNLDVEDIIPDGPGWAEGSFTVKVGVFPRHKERYNIRLELERFVPGAEVNIVGDTRNLRLAKLQGVILKKREKTQDIYLVTALETKAHSKKKHPVVGFDNLPVDRGFPLKIIYRLPGNKKIQQRLMKESKRHYEIRFVQYFGEDAVGAFCLRLRINWKVLPRKNP